VISANPDADVPMGEIMTKEQFLHSVFLHNVEQFVDWSSGVVHFDRGGFAELLELADMFPMEAEPDIDLNLGNWAWAGAVASGCQIMQSMHFTDFLFYQMDRSIFGGEIIFKGYPSESRTGSSFYSIGDISITAHSENQQEAWEFIRLLMSGDFGRDNLNMVLPVNKVLFEERLDNAMKSGSSEMIIQIGLQNGLRVSIPAISTEEADRIRYLIDSATGVIEHDEILWNIISENASDFFNGRHTAQETARIIQRRASIYIAEQAG